MKKKILVVNDLLQGGGVEKLMHDIVMYFHDKYDITILTDVMDEEFYKIYPTDVNSLYQMEKPYPEAKNIIERKKINFQRKRREKKLKETIAKTGFDVLLCLKESWIMMMAMTYGEYIPKKIAWVHTDYTSSYYTKDWYKTEENEVNFMKKFDNVICVSKVIQNSIKEVIGDPGNLIVRYNPVDMSEIIEKSREPVEDIRRSERPLFVTVGRLNDQKGYDRLMEICHIMNTEGHKYDVWIIGGGEAWDNYGVQRKLEGLISKFKLDNVYMLGPKKNPYKYMALGDWFLSTSRYEGFSYVSQEAAILNKPLILTDCAGVMELLQEKDNGIVMENSIAGIYLGMRDVILNPEKKEQYTNRIPEEMVKNCWDDRMKQIESLFD